MMENPTILRLAVVLVGLAARALASIGPQNTAVVVNADSWASLTVANEFISLRNIPAANVIHLHLRSLYDFEQIPVDNFRQLVLAPVLTEIRLRGLADQIDCIAYSADLPYAINVSSDVGQQKLPNVITKTASINGLTFLYQKVLARDINYLGLNTNRYAPRVIDEPRIAFTEAQRGQEMAAFELGRQGRWPEAAAIFAELARAHPTSYALKYDLACCLAKQQRNDQAMAALTEAVNAGWWDAARMRDNDDFKSLRERKDFKDLLARIRPPSVQLRPPPCFRSSCGWDSDGKPLAARPDQGYLLSTMLSVTSGRGNSIREVREALRRSASADGSAPRGTVYYMLSSDIRATTRRWGFDAAVGKLKELGVAAQIANGIFPMKRPDVAGAMIGASDFDWKACGSSILPGAICEHLTSTGGVMVHYGGQTPISEFIRYGAAGASGTVTEPYALQAKFPTPFLHVYYAQGCTLAEAFYLSIAGPYQLLIVGDPLCRPWARIPTVAVAGLESGATVKGTLTLGPAVKSAGLPVARYEVFVDGRRHSTVSTGGDFPLDTTKLSDGYHELRIVAVCADSIETQGQCILPFYVDNAGRQMAVSPIANKSITWGSPVVLQAGMPGGKRILIIHNNRELAGIDGEKGQAQIDSRVLGLGRVRLHAVGIFPRPGGDQRVASAPIELEVLPPPALPAIVSDAGAKGLLLRPAGRPPIVIESGYITEHLPKAGLRPDEGFVLEGFFDVPVADLYQFQLRFNGRAAIEVDGKPLDAPVADVWNYLLVSLAPGTHHLRARFEAKGLPRLDLRFGPPGAYTIRGERFRHARLPATGPLPPLVKAP